MGNANGCLVYLSKLISLMDGLTLADIKDLFPQSNCGAFVSSYLLISTIADDEPRNVVK